MAILTSSRQLIGHVVRIHGAIIIRLVTAHAGIRRIVVIAVVTSSAIIRDPGVCPKQGVRTVVDREGGRRPAWSRSMAHRAIRRDHQRHVIWIQTRVVIGGVTARTGVRRIVVIAVVAGIAIVFNRNVRPGEREESTVVKS